MLTREYYARAMFSLGQDPRGELHAGAVIRALRYTSDVRESDLLSVLGVTRQALNQVEHSRRLHRNTIARYMAGIIRAWPTRSARRG